MSEQEWKQEPNAVPANHPTWAHRYHAGETNNCRRYSTARGSKTHCSLHLPLQAQVIHLPQLTHWDWNHPHPVSKTKINMGCPKRRYGTSSSLFSLRFKPSEASSSSTPAQCTRPGMHPQFVPWRSNLSTPMQGNASEARTLSKNAALVALASGSVLVPMMLKCDITADALCSTIPYHAVMSPSKNDMMSGTSYDTGVGIS